MAETAFDVAGRFFDEHDACPDRVVTQFWVPQDGSDAWATLTCACGGRVVIPMPSAVARVIVAQFAGRGYLVTTTPAAGLAH